VVDPDAAVAVEEVEELADVDAGAVRGGPVPAPPRAAERRWATR
jgi:hypothetical protein